MKRLLGLLLFIFSIQFINAQEQFQRISVNFSLSHPILKKNYFPDYRYYLDQEIEVLLNFKAGKSAILSTGIGVQQGEHYRQEETTFTWFDESYWRSSGFIYNWKLKFKSVLVPINILVPINNFVLDYYAVNSGIGWIYKYDLSEHHKTDVSDIDINKSFLDLSFGIGKKIFQSREIFFSLSPIVGSRIYLSNNNNWQKSYLFYQIKFNVNL